jgi:hypothetical protein
MPRWIALVCVMSLFGIASAAAQKYPGTPIPVAPAPAVKYPSPAAPQYPSSVAPQYPPSAAPQPTPSAASQPERDAAAEQRAQRLPLDPATRDLRDQLPPNVAGVERTLGLRPAHGPATDLRGRLVSPREIVDALAPRNRTQ